MFLEEVLFQLTFSIHGSTDFSSSLSLIKLNVKSHSRPSLSQPHSSKMETLSVQIFTLKFLLILLNSHALMMKRLKAQEDTNGWLKLGMDTDKSFDKILKSPWKIGFWRLKEFSKLKRMQLFLKMCLDWGQFWKKYDQLLMETLSFLMITKFHSMENQWFLKLKKSTFQIIPALSRNQ